MSRRRRAIALACLAVLLGALAASDVSRREAAARQALGPAIPVVVARSSLGPRARLTPGRLAVRRVPRRYAPAATFADPRELAGLRTAVPVAAGADLVAGMVDDGTRGGVGGPGRSGQRVVDVVAVASPRLVQAGSRVDVVVTRGAADGGGRAVLALEDVEVVASAAAPESVRSTDGAPRVAASLRVSIRQAVFLAAAQSFAREIRLLPRAAGDRSHLSGSIAVGSDLGR